MTIQFNCPNCNEVIAFQDKHCGKRAKCTSCNQQLIIPSKSFEKARKIKPPKEENPEPIPGFYRALFNDSWELLFSKKNLAGPACVIIVTCIGVVTSGMNYDLVVTGRSLSFTFPIRLDLVFDAIS